MINEEIKQPRVLVIQDISASCRISLNVAVPILSCLNNGVSVLPTALLSTHTGVYFSDYTFLDLTDEIRKIIHHWKSLELQFDGILVGYLGSIEQIELVRQIKEMFLKPDGVMVLDPVMGDNGFLYPGFDYAYVSEMRKLCREVDVLIPNMTEASFLLESAYQPGIHSEKQIEHTLKELANLNRQQVILTGVSFEKGKVGAASYQAGNADISYASGKHYPGQFDGAGDLFSSTIAGLIFQKKSLTFTIETAVTYMNRVIARTLNSGAELRFGVQFETDLSYLIKQLHNEA